MFHLGGSVSATSRPKSVQRPSAMRAVLEELYPGEPEQQRLEKLADVISDAAIELQDFVEIAIIAILDRAGVLHQGAFTPIEGMAERPHVLSWNLPFLVRCRLSTNEKLG